MAGLDYFKKFGDKRSQIELFITQLELAEKNNVPVIIHNRDAGKDVLDILSERMPSAGVVLHCYSEDANYAKEILSNKKLDGVYFSFAGNVTYRNTRNLHDTVLNVPLERILVESESPFMVPAEFRNNRNMPAYIKSTVRFLADLLKNAAQIFRKSVFINPCLLLQNGVFN